ncbi:MAG TPA: neutral/alkaline non-lysosomal ceramidase N-terminal domain-containing protein [Bryobacteraceae bacterium]|nr:neutral/alkaline non-lysosomal ceramidase N-terminal domain-containing protein [Bryobacteraceae bacterium]
MAAVDITPSKSIWMAGYAARKHSSEGALQPIHAKALALEDRSGRPAVLVTTDLLGLTAKVAGNIAERAEKQYHLTRDRLMFNSSHTHCGPVIDRMLAVAYDLTPQQWADIDDYTRALEDKIVGVIGAALNGMHPARLSFGHTQAGFAKNRRTSFDPNGPVDHDVPFLKIEDPKGNLRGVVFGYACHNTTIDANVCQFNGDYAGFAQADLERRFPGATAFFVEGCGADANPNPRGTVEHARTHGQDLAGAVAQALSGKLDAVGGPLATRFEHVTVEFATPPTRQELEARLQDKNPYIRRHAQAMLDILNRGGQLRTTYPYPIQVWQFGKDLTLVALGGEVVVDYALRLKRELGAARLWVAGYSNDVFAYIPSRRVLQEGGYEGGGAMIYYVEPGPFAPSVEETIISKTEEMVRSLTTGTSAKAARPAGLSTSR